MNKISFDLSGKINQQTVDALSLVKNIADSLSIPFFVVGASARDIILEHCYGIKPQRMTSDIDLGVKVASWEKFTNLTEALRSTGKFFPDSRQRQRYHFNSVLIDIVPFGPIADEGRRIAWPPENEIIMSMVGFKEAFEYSITVRLWAEPALDIQLPTLPGLALMKLISWKEKYPDRIKDAGDLLLIMENYEDAGNFDRLYDCEQDLLQEENFDTRNASIRLLGQDMAKIADAETREVVKTILDNETGEKSQFRLVRNMIKDFLVYSDRFETILLQVEKLKKGLSDDPSVVTKV